MTTSINNDTTSIKITEGFTFSPKDLELYKKVNSSKERFPQIYKHENNGKIYQELVPIDNINIPNELTQRVREGGNSARKDIELDINRKGFNLDGLTIVLTPGIGKKYDIVDGVTKTHILSEKDVKNVPATIIENISEPDRLKLGIQLNHKDKPYGQADIGDIKKVIKELYKLKTVKQNGISLEQSILDNINEMAGSHIPENKLNLTITEIVEDISGITNLRTYTPDSAAKRIEKLGLVTDDQTIYKAVAINESKNLSTAIKAYNKAKAKNAHCELRLIAYVSALKPTNPKDDWNSRMKPYKKIWDEYIKDIGKCMFGTSEVLENIKLYGALPNIIDWKDVPIDELYRWK
jgi:hypothetical protein